MAKKSIPQRRQPNSVAKRNHMPKGASDPSEGDSEFSLHDSDTAARIRE